MKKIIIVIMIGNLVNAQNKDLDSLRLNYCVKKCKDYHKELLERSKIPMPSKFRKEKFLKAFNIPLEQRLQLTPFREYDSIYLALPNHSEISIDSILQKKDSIDYLVPKNHTKNKLLTAEDINHLSNILFNYYLFHDDNTKVYEDNACSCPYILYPKLILIFYKNGKDSDILTFYDKGGYSTSIQNFAIDGYDRKKNEIFNLLHK